MNSVSDIQSPRSLQNWQNTLTPNNIPVDPTVKATAIQKLYAAHGSAGHVAAVIAEDPVLVLRLVHKANQLLMRSGNEVKSLSHAISLLGFHQTEQLLRDAPDYGQDTLAHSEPLRQQRSISLHAARQLQGWAEQIPRWSEDGLFLATLLQRAPIWALWHQAPALMASLQTHHTGNHAAVEQRVLGCPIQRLAAALSRQWHLPTLTQQSWHPSERGRYRQWIMLSRIIPEQAPLALERFPELQQLSASRAFAIALANRFADEVDGDWYSRRSQRLQRILATCMAAPLAGAIAVTHRQAAIASREYRLRGTYAPASQLLCGYQRQQGSPVPEASIIADDAPPAAEEAPAIPAAPVPATLSALIQQLRHHPQAFSSLPDLFTVALTLLCRDVRFDRVCALLFHGPSRELRTRFSVGCEDSPQLKRFRHRPQRGDLFSRLLQQPLSLRVLADNHAQLSPLLPATFKQACATDQFLVMSVFAGDKPISILYADRAISKRPLVGQQYTLFKQLCGALGQCIAERAGG